MDNSIVAAPGEWYLDRASGSTFQVVTVDESDRSIGIQYADGSLEEMSSDDWKTNDLERCEQPEDWVGPYDDLESDDIGMPEASGEAHPADIPMERALREIEEQGPDPMDDTDG